jgi:hypothetical protein
MIDGLPKIDPKYLTNNDLWDTSWLKEKYPERFRDDRATSTVKKD